MWWRVAILVGCLAAIAAVYASAPYASDRGRRFVPFGVAVFTSWAVFYTLLLSGWSAVSLPVVFMARLSMTLTITIGVCGALAMKAEGVEKSETTARMLRLDAVVERQRDGLRDQIDES